ncbi:MAG TPA: hypothetical protein VEN81_11185 [Planctomycetota bacterium]|nr:hypothetical protein [Planctomycetota bacterium]
MPISAAAFVVSAPQLEKLGERAQKDDLDGFWELLHSGGRRVQPDYPHSGYVISVLLEYLEEQGLHVVSVDAGRDAERISEGALGLQFCLTRPEAASAAQALGEFRVSEAEFLSYYEEFADEPLAHAGGAMMEGMEYLRRVLAAPASDEDRVLLFVG